MQNAERREEFITIYTDAGFHHERQLAKIAFRARCNLGWVEGAKEIRCRDIHFAEMSAIEFACEEIIKKYPHVVGFFINSDNLNCVRAFWTFGNFKCPSTAVTPYKRILELAGNRWIRTKHVKAHTGQKDVRSHMNRTVDRMTKMRGQ